jgi:hypothetical protein
VSQPASEPNEPPREIDPGAASEPTPEASSDRVIAIGRATLRGVDFRKARFDHFSLAGCLFLSCDFRTLRFDTRYAPLLASRPGNLFRDCRFDGADLRRVRPGETRFERCTFDDALLDGWRSEAAEFVGCRFAGDLGRVTFHGRPTGNAGRGVLRKRNEFAQNDFTDAELDGVVFTYGIDLDAQRFPLSERYVRLDRFPQRLARARAEVVRWEVQEERVAAVAMLRVLATRYRDQRDVIAPRTAADGPSARVQTRVWTVLERAI